MDDKLRSRLEKLQNLAERGVGGEQETAKRKLAQLLKDNDLTEEDIGNDAKSYHLFSYVYPYRQKLLCQIIYKVLGPQEGIAMYKTKGTRNKIGAYCTAAQKMEIELDFEFYSNLLDMEISTLTEAFISKQDIFPEGTEVTSIDRSELTPAEYNEYLKRMSYASNIETRTRSLMIEDVSN